MTQEQTLYRTTRIVWYAFSVLEALLLLRFVMKLLGANPGAAFTEFVYGITAVPLAPFQLVFETNSVGESVLEWSTLLAVAIYWFIAWGIVHLIVMGRNVGTQEAQEGLEAEDRS